MTTEHIHNWNDTCDVRYTCPSIPMYNNPELLEDCAIAKKMHEDGSN